MKNIPFGDYAGQAKYWPFFWILPGITVYFLVLPFLICLPWQFKVIKNDLKKLKNKLKALKRFQTN